MKITGIVAMLAMASTVFAQGARGPYHDRAEQEAALKRLSPDEELRVRAWAAEHPEAARRLRGRIVRDPQAAMLEELDKRSPEENDERGGDAGIPVQ